MRRLINQRLRAETLEARTLLSADGLSGDPDAGQVSSLSDEIEGQSYVAGDSNHDGQFDRYDLIQVLEANTYRTAEAADWSLGDWNQDDTFDQRDIVFALQSGNYVGQAFGMNNKQSASVFRFADGSQVDGGGSSLIRTPNGVNARLSTSDLQPGAHTLWFVVFNNPEACSENECGEDDLFDDAVNATLAYGDGKVVGPSGNATFAAHLGEGDTSGYPADFTPAFGVEFPGMEAGLQDADTAEIHLIVRDHGPADPGRLHDQIHTAEFVLDCSLPGNTAPTCVTDVQFASHMP